MTESALLRQVGGSHYKGLGIQPIEFAMVNRYDAGAFSTLKYLTRHKAKNGIEDLKKARHFVELRLDVMRGNPELCAMVALDVISIEAYIESNKIDPADASVLRDLHFWVLRTNRLMADAASARHIVQKIDLLIDLHYPT